jgi:hypothetical protein
MDQPKLPLNEKVRITSILSRSITSTWIESIVVFLFSGIPFTDSIFHRGIDLQSEIERRAEEGRYG